MIPFVQVWCLNKYWWHATCPTTFLDGITMLQCYNAFELSTLFCQASPCYTWKKFLTAWTAQKRVCHFLNQAILDTVSWCKKSVPCLSKMLKLTFRPWWSWLIVLTKVMDYWLVAGSLSVHWLGGPCDIYYWKYMQRIMVTMSMGISCNTPLYDTWSSGSREKDWGGDPWGDEMVWLSCDALPGGV